jgi:hypothetical protein
MIKAMEEISGRTEQLAKKLIMASTVTAVL